MNQKEFENEVLSARLGLEFDKIIDKEAKAFATYSFCGVLLFVAACLSLLLILGGCGMVNGESDYIPYAQALESHSTSEASRIETQSQAITNVLLTAKTQTQTERSLMAVFAMMQIGQLHPVAMNIIKPTTGYDVLQRHVGTGLSILTAGVTDYFAWDAVKEMTRLGGNRFYGDVNADGSFNALENHITGSDSAALTSTATTEKPVTTYEPSPLEEVVE